MKDVISLRFRRTGKTYYYSPGQEEIRNGDKVIAETNAGLALGEVVTGPHEVDDILIKAPLPEILRRATEEDIAHEMSNVEKEKEALRLCKEKIAEHGLDMKLISCEYTFDNSKILFNFTSDGRVDFRELVKELASIFRTRIELRQVGVRDETKLLGGLGACGRPLCCATYLNDFAPVSIKMAKEQNLSLNPVKISGVCGRLMCCLNNEEEVYEELNKKLPGIGDLVDMADGSSGIVQSVGILKQKVRVVVDLPGDEKEIREYSADDITVRLRRRERNRMREEAEARKVHTDRAEHKTKDRTEFRATTGTAPKTEAPAATEAVPARSADTKASAAGNAQTQKGHRTDSRPVGLEGRREGRTRHFGPSGGGRGRGFGQQKG